MTKRHLVFGDGFFSGSLFAGAVLESLDHGLTAVNVALFVSAIVFFYKHCRESVMDEQV